MSLNENNTDVNVDNIIEGPKKKKIEKKKDIKYPTQRNEVLRKVYEIIGVSQTKPYFRSHEIDFSDGNSVDFLGFVTKLVPFARVARAEWKE